MAGCSCEIETEGQSLPSVKEQFAPLTHEKLNQAMTLKVNKFNPETGEFIESVEFINGSNAEYRLDIETRKEITTKCLVKTQR